MNQRKMLEMIIRSSAILACNVVLQAPMLAGFSTFRIDVVFDRSFGHLFVAYILIITSNSTLTTFTY